MMITQPVSKAERRQRQEELHRLCTRIVDDPHRIDDDTVAALKGLIAIERGVEELHQKDVAFPTAVQLRLGIVAVLGTWLQQLPKMWWNELSAGLRFRAPADRQTAMSYWAAIEPSLRRQIAQRTGEVEPTKRRVVGEKEEAA